MALFTAKINRPNYHTSAPDSFNDETVGTQGLDIDWIDVLDQGPAAQFEIIEILDNHKNVLELDHLGDAQPVECTHAMVPADTGIIEFWLATSDVTTLTTFYLFSSLLSICTLYIDDSKIYYEQAGAQDSGVVPVNSILNHFKIQWDVNRGAFGEAKLWIDEVLIVDWAASSVDLVDRDEFNITISEDAAKKVYIDAWGNVADDNYNEGDNLESLTDITEEIIRAKIEEELYEISTAELDVKESLDLYTAGLEITFYDKDDVLSWRGFILAPEPLESTTDIVNRVRCVGISSYFDAIYRKNYTTLVDSDTILKDIIDSYLVTHHSYGTEIDNFTTTYKYDLKKPIMKMLYYLAMLERGVIHHLPDGEMFFRAYDNLTAMESAGFYPGSPDNFNDEVVGTTGLDIAWIDLVQDLEDVEVDIVASWQDHSNVLRLHDDVTPGDDPEVIHLIDNQSTSGIVEFYIGTDDVTGEWYVHLYELDGADDTIVRLQIRDSKLNWFKKGVGWLEIKAAANNILYHIKFQWYADNTFDMTVDEVLEVEGEDTAQNMWEGPNRFYMFGWGDTDNYLYLDAWGNVADDNYNEGDNLSLVYKFDTTQNFKITKYIPATNRHITRAPVIGGYNSLGQVYVVGVAGTQEADELLYGIRELQTWRDSEITNYTEADQLATNLQTIYAIDTQFIQAITQGFGHFQVGYTINVESGEVYIIEDQAFLIFRRVWYPLQDLTYLTLTDNILSEGEFKRRVSTHLYDIEAQQSYEDPDLIESSADGTVIPLHSVAELRAGGTPGLIIYLHQDASGDIGGYLLMCVDPADDAKTEVMNITVNADNQELEQWATPVDCPQITELIRGSVELHAHTYKFSGTKDLRIYFKFYKRAAGGAETLIGTSAESNILADAENEENIHLYIETTALLETDRLVLKIFARLIGAGVNPVIYFYVEGVTLASLLVPISSFQPASVPGALQNIVEDTTPQLGGDLDLNNYNIALETSLADHKVSGLTLVMTAGENLVFGDFCYIKSDGKMWKADADAYTTMPIVAMASDTITAEATGIFLLLGTARDDTWALTVTGGMNNLIYASTTLGGIQSAMPTGEGDEVQPVGWAITATVINFNPNSWIWRNVLTT